ncbi:MAG: glycoside hydrolase family 3 C-terminal domain-containing protein, partial [Muribaculaceae bacterium]|nr:glycoside hydrolase family 3 C-terminal domain-containing protein [Muribaculaceae bacterium]
MKFRLELLTSALIGGALWSAAQKPIPLYLDDSKPLESRVQDALSRMTTAEKIGIIHAQSKFSSPGVQRLGIPGIWCTDGPHGIRPDVLWDEWEQAGATNDSCVAFPALTCLAATWNPEMSRLYGESIGEEARYRNKNVLLGPGVNIYRTPLNGRNFEYMGEDPYLSSRMVIPYITGVQSNGVAACVKHYALNNQEVDRDHVNVIVDDRTLHEIYLPAFKAAVVEGGAWSIMPGYNKYNGEHACENPTLLLDILKNDWGFDGVAISDWGAVHNTEKVAQNGLDMEFGSWTNGLNWGASNAYDDYFLAKPYEKLINEGKLPMSQLDDKAARVLRLIMRTEMDRNRPYGSLNSDEHYAAARKIGGEGVVLLKNENNLLPLSPSKTKKILVVGENAIKMMTVGGGSSSLKVQRELLPLEGIKEYAAGNGVDVAYERGYVGDVTGEYNGVTTGQDLSESRSAEQLIADAVKAAKEADAVIFVGGLNKSDHQDAEGTDRNQFSLPYNQDTVIEALAKANPNLVVVSLTGNAYAMPWLKDVPAVVQGWYGGSEAGHIIADVLFGEVNPSGKLPMTFAKDLTNYAAHATGDSLVYPGVNGDVVYKEGLNVGYRHTDRLKRGNVNFAFGHGLSYTDFSFGNPTASGKEFDGEGVFTVTVPVSNVGQRNGSEVVQGYVRDVKSSVARPDKELKAFGKVNVNPGETENVTLTFDKSSFAYYDPNTHMWTVEPGKFEILIGNASDNIIAKVQVDVKETITWSDSVR